MKQDWETKRYTLDNLGKKNGITNENSSNTDWIDILLKSTIWRNIEGIIFDGNHPLLSKEQILSIHTNLNSNILDGVNHGIEEMRNILFNVIHYLYTDLHLEGNEAVKELNSADKVEDVDDMLQVLDILAVITPPIQAYIKILLNAKIEIPGYNKILHIVTHRYAELFGITLIWILENCIKSTLPHGLTVFEEYPLAISNNALIFYDSSSPEVLDTQKKQYKTAVFMRNEGIKQVDIEEGKVYRHLSIEALTKKILKPLATPINKFFLLVGAEGSGKTTFLRAFMANYGGDAFYAALHPVHLTTPPDWKQVHQQIVSQYSQYTYSRIAPVFIIDQLHYLQDFDALWVDFILPILSNNKFEGRIILCNRNASSFHAKILDTYRGKLKSLINTIFLNNIMCIQRDTHYLSELITLYLNQKQQYPYKTLVSQDHFLHQLLFQISDNLNIILLKNFLQSIDWDEYPEFFEDKLQKWMHEYTLRELHFPPQLSGLEPEIKNMHEQYRITLLYLISLASIQDKTLTLSDFYNTIAIRNEIDDIFLTLAELMHQGWIHRELICEDTPLFHYRFYNQVDAKRIFTVLSSEFQQTKEYLRFPFNLHSSEDIYKFEWVKRQFKLPNAFKWEEFGVFRTEPLLKLEPLNDEEQLEKFFITPNIQDKIFDIGRLFGDRILLLGDYKVGKTSLKNRIIHLLKKDLDILQVTINVTKIKEIGGNDVSESVSKNIYKQWYKNLYKNYYYSDYRDDAKPFKFGDSEEYLDRLLDLYHEIFTKNPQKLSVIVFEANQLEIQDEVLPFKIFAEIFQVVWENDFSEFLRSRIFILCIGNRSWISYFNIDQTKRFGVFPSWLLFEDWDIPKLQQMLEKRVQYALYPKYNHLMPSIIPQNLINKLYDTHGKQISAWLMSFKEFLVEFSKDFDYFKRDISKFNRFLDLRYFSQEEYTKLVNKYRIITLCNDLTKFRVKNNSTLFKDVIDLIGYVYEKKSVGLTEFAEYLNNPMFTISEELILKRLTAEKDEKNKPYPFRINKDRIRLKKSLRKFLEEIESRTNLKEPHEILFKYLGREKVTKHKKDTNVDYINDVSTILSNVATFAREKENMELERFIRDIVDNQIEQITIKAEVLDNLTKAEDKNSVMLDIKRLIAESLNLIMEIPILLFDLSDDNIQETFSAFVKKNWDPTDNYNWRWVYTIDSLSPVEFNETVRQFHKFCFNFDIVLSNFNKLDSYQKTSIIDGLRTELTADAPIVFKQGRALDEESVLEPGVLWVVDGPNVHYLDIEKAEQYIRDNILQKDEHLDKIVCIKHSYKFPHSHFYEIYKRYMEAGFIIDFPAGKNKEEDVDEYFTYMVHNKFIDHKYRVLILGSVDGMAIRLIHQKIQEYPDLRVYIFGDGVSKLSWNTFYEYFDKEMLNKVYRAFSLKHRKLDDGTYRGIVEVYPQQAQKFEDGRLFISYAENGKDLSYKVDKFSKLPMDPDVFFSVDRSLQVIFSPSYEGSRYVTIHSAAPIEETLIYEGYDWCKREKKEFMTMVDLEESLSKWNYPFEDGIIEFVRDAINRRLMFDYLSGKFISWLNTENIVNPNETDVNTFLQMFPPNLFPEFQLEYTDDFKKELVRMAGKT
jgi:GTPase SAR1 family protein/ferritin